MLSRSTIEKLKYYVYLLSDPRTGKVFYVGKGKGNRINAHVLGALDTSTKETQKIQTIRDIQNSGHEVEHSILRHGLSEKEALEVESAVIDFVGIEHLTNIMKGHHARVRGKMKVSDLEVEYQAKPAVFEEHVILIRINQLYRHDMSAEELYEATRKDWVISKQRAETIPIACAVYAGIVREVYAVSRWLPSLETKGRYLFEGTVAPSEIRKKYLHTSVAHVWKHGSQNPIKYVP